MQKEKSPWAEEDAQVPGSGRWVGELKSQEKMQEGAVRGRRVHRGRSIVGEWSSEPVNFWLQIPRGLGEHWRKLWAGNKDAGTSSNGEPRIVIEITCKYRGLRFLHRFRTPT